MNKKKLLVNGILILGLSMLFAGCDNDPPKDNINTKSTIIATTRFTTTNDTYTINDDDYKIIVDNETDNVYLSCKAYGNRGIDTFPLLDKDGRPVKYKDLTNKQK